MYRFWMVLVGFGKHEPKASTAQLIPCRSRPDALPGERMEVELKCRALQVECGNLKKARRACNVMSHLESRNHGSR